MKQIKLYGMRGDNKFAIVDDDVALKDYVADNKWTLNKMGYVIMSSGTTLLHQAVYVAPKGYVIDHINHDKLDNRRENLRLCTRKENVRNQLAHKDNTSGYKGVTRSGKYYKAAIGVDGSVIYLGSFGSRHDAARAYNEAATEHFGEFASLNKIQSGAGNEKF
jgi:hypothetical protein